MIELTSKALDVLRCCAEAAANIAAVSGSPVVVMDGEPPRRTNPGDALYPKLGERE